MNTGFSYLVEARGVEPLIYIYKTALLCHFIDITCHFTCRLLPTILHLHGLDLGSLLDMMIVDIIVHSLHLYRWFSVGVAVVSDLRHDLVVEPINVLHLLDAQVIVQLRQHGVVILILYSAFGIATGPFQFLCDEISQVLNDLHRLTLSRR